MITLKTNIEARSVLIGNQDWTFAIPTVPEDGTMTVIVDPNFDEMRELEDAHDLKFIGFARGSFGIYENDGIYRNLHMHGILVQPMYILPKGIYLITTDDDLIVFQKTEIWKIKTFKERDSIYEQIRRRND